MLMVPDLIGYWLTGVMAAEETNGSTTGLFDIERRGWATDLLDELGLPRRDPASDRSARRDRRRAAPRDRHRRRPRDRHLCWPMSARTTRPRRSWASRPRTTLRLHRVRDVGARRRRARAADPDRGKPVSELHERARASTAGSGYLRNVMGLWLLQESLRTWENAGEPSDLSGLLAAAAELPARRPADRRRRPGRSCRRATCRRGSRRRAGRPARRRRSGPASARPLHPRQPGRRVRADRRGRGAAVRPRRRGWSTSSAAAAATRCCASSPPTPAAGRSWPARSRRPRSATCWSRRGRTGSSRAISRRCARSCAATFPLQPLRATAPSSAAGDHDHMKPRRRLPRWRELQPYLRTGPIQPQPDGSPPGVRRHDLGPSIGRAPAHTASGLRLRRRRGRERDEPAAIARGLRSRRVRAERAPGRVAGRHLDDDPRTAVRPAPRLRADRLHPADEP